MRILRIPGVLESQGKLLLGQQRGEDGSVVSRRQVVILTTGREL
jgi:hypothetical protein